MRQYTEDLGRLLPVLRHVLAHLGMKQTATGKAVGLTSSRTMALAVLDTADACSMSDLARSLDLSAPLATRLANELVERELAERVHDHGDRRRVQLRITPGGRNALSLVHGEAEELLSSVVLNMTETESDALLVGLRAFLRVLHAPAPGETAPSLPACGPAS